MLINIGFCVHRTSSPYNSSLNAVIGNAKRFLAYEIIKRLDEQKANSLLEILHAGVKKREHEKGQTQGF